MTSDDNGSRVAVIVVTWNGLEDTIHCLSALRRVATPALHVVLVDNASRDGTATTVRRYFPEVTIIVNAENRGYAEANNQGIAYGLSKGADWILLLNNDVVTEPGAIEEMLRVSRELPDVGILGPRMRRTLRPDIIDLGGDLDFRWGSVRLRRYEPALDERDWLTVDYVWGCALLARGEVFRQVGLLDPAYVAYFEDADLCLRALAAGYRTVVALHAAVTHKVGASGEKRFLWQTYYRIRNHGLFFLRYAAWYDTLTLLPALFLYHVPYILLQSTRAYVARRLYWRKYARRPITLWGYERAVLPPKAPQIEEWLDEAGYSACR